MPPHHDHSGTEPHEHAHPHAAQPSPGKGHGASLLSCGVWQRLGFTVVLLAPVWLAVAWALYE